eukprot:1485408-Prymnesium_polylepis.1
MAAPTAAPATTPALDEPPAAAVLAALIDSRPGGAGAGGNGDAGDRSVAPAAGGEEGDEGVKGGGEEGGRDGGVCGR